TKDGSIVYTSNFVFDSTMQTYYKTDIGKLAYIGKQNVLCLLSESIYATKEGFTAPSNRTYDLLKSTINKYDKRILYNVFQNQLYRIQELFDALIQTHRNIVVLGKALEKLIYDSIDNGYLKFDKERILPLSHINDNNIVVIISDEREKAFSNLKRIVKGYDKFLKLTSEDTLVFASPIYDGLEKDSTKLFDDVSKIGCNLVIVSKKYKSFHASIEDLMMMINLMQPKYYFPVIGEYRHQVANKELALKLNMNEENILLKLNGQVVYFENGVLKDNNEIIPTSDILIDGNTSSDIGELVIKDREMLADNGIVVVVATLDKKTKQILAGPEILTRGFVYVKDNIDLIKESSSLAINVINNNVTNNYVDYNKIRNQIREVLGDYFMDETECRPMILTVIGEV
ncbi:MAG: ribonuclease J, partial [Bacilli bacterium]|nr:ribonuclease J [Bacilli bacterium]